jgi:Zn-dependent M28 family amino/carboxypeptidase
VTGANDATDDAPGANDDGSGTAAVIEAARVLSKHKFPATIVYAVLSGEEQGTFGGKVEANYARAHNWRVEAVLNNDIVGNTHGQNGAHITDYVRVFSEGTKAVETPAESARRRYSGGEVDSPARNLARFIDALAPQYLPGFRARMIYRTDRFGRGGDQTPMLEAGYPAVRVTEAAENWNRQHQDLRPGFGDTIDGVDFAYLANVTRMNAITLAALAMAPPPPEGIKIQGALKDDTDVTWEAAKGAGSYRVWWRDTLSPRWEQAVPVNGLSTTVKDVLIDDWTFGVQAVSADGWASPIAFPGPPGSFVSPAPTTPPPPSR